MAFYSLWKWFSPWSKRFSKIEYTSMIYWYKEYVLKTTEQREQERMEKKRKARNVMAQLGVTTDLCSRLGGV